MSSEGIIPVTENFVISATQVSAYELCPRKWAFRYIDGVDAPPNKFAELGIDTHGHLENWLKFNVVPLGEDKSVKLAQALIPLLPPPQAVDQKNVEIDQMYELCGVHFNLKSDLFMPKWRDDLPSVFDHKTGNNPDYWLTSDKMPHDVQVTLYAGWALHKTLAPAVDMQWNYVRTKGAIKTEPVIARLNGRSIQERLGKTLDTGREMKVVMESGAKALQVPYQASGCTAFGGCPYQERCNLQPADRLRSIMSQVTQQPLTSQSTQAFLGALAPQNGQPQPVNPPPTQLPVQQPQYAQPAQQPQYAPQPQPQYAPAPQQQYAQPAQQPLPLAPQQVQTVAPPVQQQEPVFVQPQQQAFVPQAPSPTTAEAASKGRGRPNKLTAEDPWVYFATHAPPGQDPCAWADYMENELKRRRG